MFALVMAGDGWGGIRLDQYRIAHDMDVREAVGLFQVRLENMPDIEGEREKGRKGETGKPVVSEQRVGNRVTRTTNMELQEWMDISRK